LPAVLEGLAGMAADFNETGEDSLTGIVTVTDDGGSSGRLRQQFGVLPPGDVRNCLVALARQDSPFKPLLQHRFDDESGRMDTRWVIFCSPHLRKLPETLHRPSTSSAR
jgi:uncharacterized cofD-like protein